MKLKQLLLQSTDFLLKDNIFYQRALEPTGEFEQNYLCIRKKENRYYTDDIVETLPSVPSEHPLRGEWKVRESSSQRLLKFIAIKSNAPAILEVGCGNGWLSNRLATIPNSEVLGVDINKTELKQASRVFSDRENLCFACADIFTSHLPSAYFDFVVMAASVQYFSNIENLLDRLLTLLSPRGEVHLLDSPLYPAKGVATARIRSQSYFRSNNADMEKYYHHHTWESLSKYHYAVLHKPGSIGNRILRTFTVSSPFPWVRIRSIKS